MLLDRLYASSTETGLFLAASVWGVAEEGFCVVKRGIERVYPAVTDAHVVAVCGLVSLVALHVLWTISATLGLLALGGGLIVLGCGYIVHQEKTIESLKQTAALAQVFFQNTVNGFCSIIGDREQLLAALAETKEGLTNTQNSLEEALGEKGRLTGQVGSLIGRIDGLEVLLHTMNGLLDTFRGYPALTEQCNAIARIFSQAQALFTQGNQDLANSVAAFDQTLKSLTVDQVILKGIALEILATVQKTDKKLESLEVVAKAKTTDIEEGMVVDQIA